MRRSPVLSALERHYEANWGELAKIDAEIVSAGHVGEALRKRMGPKIASLKAALTHIEFCLRLVDPDWTRDRVKAKKPRKRPDPDKWGHLLNMAYDVLRDSLDTPLTTVEILEELWARGRIKGRREIEDYKSRLTSLLRGQERVGAVRSFGQSPLSWAIIRSRAQLQGADGTG